MVPATIRKRSRYTMATAAATSVLLFLLAACSSSQSTTASTATNSLPFKTITPGVLTVAQGGTDAYNVIVSPDGKSFTGIGGDLVNAFAKKYGLTVKVVTNGDYGALVLGDEENKADLTIDLVYSPQRAQIIKYGAAFSVGYLVAVTRAGYAFQGNSTSASLVGTSTGYGWVPEMSKWNSGIKLFATSTLLSQALLNKQIDVEVNTNEVTYSPPFDYSNAPVGVPNPNVAVEHILTAGEFGIPASLLKTAGYITSSCKNQAIANAFTAFLKQEAASGALQALFNKYKVPAAAMPTTFSQPASCLGA
jgi:ABC-type amino acid transport substrate-binding protein